MRISYQYWLSNTRGLSREREGGRQTPERKRKPGAMAALLSLVESASKEISEIA
jgi:hypothetical protein